MSKADLNQFPEEPTIAVIGSGSWATALLKILEDRQHHLHWWVRQSTSIEQIHQNHRNPKYLSSLDLDLSRITLTDNVKEALKPAHVVLLAVPSFFLKDALEGLEADAFQGKLVISAIKGIVPGANQLVSQYMAIRFQVPYEDFVNISGPSHAEEVAFGRKTFLTLASHSDENAAYIRNLFQTDYLKITLSDDLLGLEYAAVFKNVYAIAGGICNSLGYGDNFQAVLVAAAAREMQHFLDCVVPGKRNINDAGYLGDLLVTAYSQFSRNRTFGNMIGKGYSTKAALVEMNMVPEGYYAVQPAYELIQKHEVDAPILRTVYHILYDGIPPANAFLEIEDRLA